MRTLLISAVSLVLAAPVLAQPYPDPEQTPYPEQTDVARELPSQHEIDALGTVMERMVGAMMDMPIGGIVEAMEPGRVMTEAERNQTVRDMATRDDPYAEERMRGSIDAMTGQMGAMTEQLAVLIPVLSRSMVDFQRRMEEAVRPYDRDWDE